MSIKILKFNLSGQFAFFKNPEVNSNYYFTFNNIHKVALLGILGSILGLKGYNQQGEDDYPEFYDKLKDLNVSIVPKSDICPNKKIQTFNNSTMFYNKRSTDSEQVNLIIKEEWIENPSWDIYIQINIDNKIENELLSRITEQRYVYIPYIGKNDHFANITEVKVFNSENIKILEESTFKIDSFYLKGNYKEAIDDWYDEGDNILRYREYLPFDLNIYTNHYEYKMVEYSSGELEPTSDNIKAYNINNINISFM